eukprot:10590.XXX_416035_416166_1 [CDS] Oithona nana genome sequencing.
MGGGLRWAKIGIAPQLVRVRNNKSFSPWTRHIFFHLESLNGRH